MEEEYAPEGIDAARVDTWITANVEGAGRAENRRVAMSVVDNPGHVEVKGAETN